MASTSEQTSDRTIRVVATGDRDGRCRDVPTNPDGGMDVAIASAASLWRVKRHKPIIGRIAA
jgi:glucose/arabinose dehydrogenase